LNAGDEVQTLFPERRPRVDDGLLQALPPAVRGLSSIGINSSNSIEDPAPIVDG
jgi:hypothetical protein